MKVKTLILGAGPAGLSAAARLMSHGDTSFLVLEQEKEAGGLCRSAQVDGSPMDIGGGHFLDVRRPSVNDFLFRFMPEEEWNVFDRDSRINVKGNIVHHPIEANIWEMPLDNQIDYLKSIAAAGCNTGEASPAVFVDWIYWKLGDRIAEDYMIPYNQKMFGEDLNALGTYWLAKLPDVSFEDTLRSCLTKHAFAKQPGHARFYYPKRYGYGEVWLRMAASLGNRIAYEQTVSGLDFNTLTVTTTDGSSFSADRIITTIPWMAFSSLSGMPEELRRSIAQLKYSSIQTEYHAEHLDTEAHWIYYPDPSLSFHRILVRHNFCTNSRGYWTETNLDRVPANQPEDCFRYTNRYAYPLNTVGKPELMRKLLSWAESRQVFGLGRWGEHRHYNSDATVELALAKADELLT